jgi:ribulose-5-phosphate 4-epimerase/fuculose-1-phosphate aldolase
MKESAIREQLAMHGRSLYDRGLAGGSTGNMSVRLEEGGFLATPTNACLGRLDPARLSKLDAEGRHVDGDKPTKETFLHLAMYRQRPGAGAVVHLHCTYSVALSCLAGHDAADVLPAITPYYVMRIGKCPLVPYFRPGDEALGEAVAELAKNYHAVMLANHGPVVSGASLEAAVYALEELEETARLFFLLSGRDVRRLTDAEIADLKAHFPAV